METLQPKLIRTGDVVFDRDDLAYARIIRVPNKQDVKHVVLHLRSAGELKIDGYQAGLVANAIETIFPDWAGGTLQTPPAMTKTTKKK